MPNKALRLTLLLLGPGWFQQSLPSRQKVG